MAQMSDSDDQRPSRRVNRKAPKEARRPGERVRALKCFDEVYKRVCEGWPPSEVAKYVQEVKRECLDMTREQLTKQVKSFRRSLPTSQLTREISPELYEKAVAEMSNGLDTLAEFEKLYRMQMNRIDIDVKNEQAIKKLLPTTGQEMRIAAEILGKYASTAMDLGLTKRDLGQVGVDVRMMHDVAVRYQRPEVEKVLNQPESRKKLLDLVERAFSRSTSEYVGAPLLDPAEPATATVDVKGEAVGEAIDNVPLAVPDNAEPVLPSEWLEASAEADASEPDPSGRDQ